jgi:putative molybdopterin biosynthesis protein
MMIESVKGALGNIWSVKEISNYIGLNERTIYRLANNGKIPGFKLGGKWVFNKEIISQWIIRETNNTYLK